MATGRPSNLTPELQAALCAKIAEGNFRETACKAVGLPARTLRLWLAKGKKAASGIYVEFLRAVIEAEGDAEIAMVKVVRDAAKTDPANARWWLERKFPERWGRDTYAIRQLRKELAELTKFVAGGRGAALPLPDWQDDNADDGDRD